MPNQYGRLLTVCWWLGLSVSVSLSLPHAWAQTCSLVETPPAGDCLRVEIDSQVEGTMRVMREGKWVELPVRAEARHVFLEKALGDATDANSRVARYYQHSTLNHSVAGETVQRSLALARRLMIVPRNPTERGGCYCPHGPLTRDELELVAEHFNTLALIGLLPGRSVEQGPAGAWPIANSVVLGLCQFEGLIDHQLTGRLEAINDGKAYFNVSGKASGIDLGAKVEITVNARCEYDLLAKRLVRVEWTQHDQRDQAPASPAMQLRSKTTITRTPLEREPDELTSVALAGVPSGPVPESLLHLREQDVAGRFRLTHSRDWYLVARTNAHTVLRLMEKGDLLAQATITPWKKALPGEHLSPEQFRHLASEAPAWQVEEVLEDGPIATSTQRYIYRHAVRGTLEGLKVVQIFYLIANPTGEQAIVTFTMRPGVLAQVGERDLALVNALELLPQ